MTTAFTYFSWVDDYQVLVSFPTSQYELWRTSPIVVELIEMNPQIEGRQALTHSNETDF